MKKPLSSNSLKKPKKQPNLNKNEAEVMRLLTRLSKILYDFRERENYDQKDMAEKLDIGHSRYNEIEKLRNLNPAFGVSLALLERFARLEQISLSSLLEKMEGQSSKLTGRTVLEEKLVAAFEEIGLEDRERFLTMVEKPPISRIIQSNLKWWVSLGIDLFSMPESDRLEFEMRTHQQLLKSAASNENESDRRRSRIYAIMREVLEDRN